MNYSSKCEACEIKDKVIDDLQDALSETFKKVAEIFGAMTEEVEKYLPDRAAYFKGCIETLNKVVCDHEKQKGLKSETKH